MWGRKPYIEIRAFDGGLNTKLSADKTPLNQSPDLANVIFDDIGAVGSVNGYAVFNTAAIATQPIDGLFSLHQSAGTQQLLAWCGGTLWQASGTTFVTVP